MPKSTFNEDEPFGTVFEAIAQNNENLKKALNSLTRIADAIDNNYDTSTNKIIAEIKTLQADIEALLTQFKKKESTSNSSPPLPNQINTCQKMQILQFKTWEEFQIFAAQPQFSAYTYRDNDRFFEINAMKNNQLLVYVGEAPKVSSMLRSWLSSQLIVAQEKVVEGTIKP